MNLSVNNNLDSVREECVDNKRSQTGGRHGRASKKQVTRAARHKQFNEGRKDL